MSIEPLAELSPELLRFTLGIISRVYWFWRYRPHFQWQKPTYKMLFFFSKKLSVLEPVDGFLSNLQWYIIMTGVFKQVDRQVNILVTLTYFQGHSLVCRIATEPMKDFSKLV